MRTILSAAVLLLLAGLPLRAAADDAAGERLVFEGTVLRLGASPGRVSGDVPAYRLVKYRVERVCSGQYAGGEIVVDHLILTGKELGRLKVGDKVCVTVRKSGKISLRQNARGIRRASDVVTTFYIGGAVADAKAPCPQPCPPAD